MTTIQILQDVYEHLKHASIIPHGDMHVLDRSVQSMIECLEEAMHTSLDPPDIPPIQATHTVRTGRPGRPRIEIDQDILAEALEMRGPTDLASVFGTSSRTIRRRALEGGLVEPGHPVYVDYEAEDGTKHHCYTSSTRSMSDLSDEELDNVTRQIIETFPDFGRRMIDGHLKFMGIRVPRARLQASYLRIHGPPSSMFGARRIQRRVYSVAGANALWHHDGQHGMNCQYLLCMLT